MKETNSGNLFAGYLPSDKNPELSSRRLLQLVMVFSQIPNRLAVSAFVQPCAARSCKICIRSPGQNRGRFLESILLNRESLIRNFSCKSCILFSASSSFACNRTLAFMLFAAHPRATIIAKCAKEIIFSTAVCKSFHQYFGNSNLQLLFITKTPGIA